MPHTEDSAALRLRRLGIDTYQEAVIYMHRDCHVCRSEGFDVQSRIEVECRGQRLLATLNVVDSELLAVDEASLSEVAWRQLDAQVPRCRQAATCPSRGAFCSTGHVSAALWTASPDRLGTVPIHLPHPR